MTLRSDAGRLFPRADSPPTWQKSNRREPGLERPSFNWASITITKEKGSSKNTTPIGLWFIHLPRVRVVGIQFKEGGRLHYFV